MLTQEQADRLLAMLHREGYGNTLTWAEPVDWYDVSKPLWTLERFLDVVHTRFPHRIQVELL